MDIFQITDLFMINQAKNMADFIDDIDSDCLEEKEDRNNIDMDAEDKCKKKL